MTTAIQCHDEMTKPSPLAHFELTPYTLSLRPGITLAAWGNGLHWLTTVEKSVQWWVGDAWIAGEAVWGEDASQYMERYANGTVRNCAVVCRRFDATWRERYKAALDADTLSFAHFQRITRIKDDTVLHDWLALAIANGWSAARLEAEIGGEVGGRATVSLSMSNMPLNAAKLAAKLSPAKLDELIDELMKLRGE
jgi:hypothetical protein